MSSPLGPFVGPAQVRGAVLATLAKWAPYYVQEAIRQTTALDLNPVMAQFVDWRNEPAISTVNPTQAPRYVVSCPGTLTQPRRKGDGTFLTDWDVAVDLWIWGTDYQSTEDRLGYYLIALREALIQHPSLGGFAQSTWWRGDRYRQAAPPTGMHTWGQGTLSLGVKVDGGMAAFNGPATPPSDPTTPPVAPPAVTSEHITIKPK